MSSTGTPPAPNPETQHDATTSSHFARPCVNFRPTIWADIFLQYDSSQSSLEVIEDMKQQVEIHKEEMKKLFLAPNNNNISQKLSLIDSIQRLGVSHHFQSEIDQELEQIHKCYANNSLTAKEEGVLHFHALLFRLLRQKGYHIPPDIFNQFKNNKGKFKENIVQDVQGMWNLYEAAHLRVHGEEILEEALDFTHTNLMSITNQLSQSLAAQITKSLKEPIHKKVPRIEARHYLSLYEEDPSHNKSLLNFAKLDFNMLQKLHQQELGSNTKWWKKSEFARKVPYARDRVVQAYFWPLAISSEPKHSTTRRIVGKCVACVSLLDDTYDDAFGTLEELEFFTHAFQRWDISPIESLPECFGVVFNAIVEVLDETDTWVTAKGGNSGLVLQHLKQAFYKLAQSYLVEANEGYIPTYEEYKVNGAVSSSYPLQITTFIGLGEFATKEVFDWIFSDPIILKAASLIGRLMDDLASHKFEQQRDHVASAVECCMKQYDISEEEAKKLICREVIDLWKDINGSCLKSDDNIPKFVLDCIINFNRITEFTYANFEDRYTNEELMKDFVVALLLDPIAIDI